MATKTTTPEAEDDLLPGGPEPDAESTDSEALRRLALVEPPSADAFVGDDSESDDALGSDPVVYVAEPGARAAADETDFSVINLGFAQLQDIKVSAARNGNNFDLVFEVDMAHLDKMPRALKGGHDITWKKIAVGQGAEIRRAGITRDVDGGLHLKLAVHMPESEISRSLGRLGPHVRTTGELMLDPMQGTLNLPGGKVNLSKRAE